MRTFPINVCPLIGNQCLEDRCAWWEYAGSECALVAGAFAIREAAENLEDLEALTGLASNSQALGNLQQKEPPRAANTERLEGGTDLTDPDSTSHDNGK